MLLAPISEQHFVWEKEPGIPEIQRKKHMEVHGHSLQCHSEVFCCPSPFLNFSLFPSFIQILWALPWFPLTPSLAEVIPSTVVDLCSLLTHQEWWQQHPQRYIFLQWHPVTWPSALGLFLQAEICHCCYRNHRLEDPCNLADQIWRTLTFGTNNKEQSLENFVVNLSGENSEIALRASGCSRTQRCALTYLVLLCGVLLSMGTVVCLHTRIMWDFKKTSKSLIPVTWNQCCALRIWTL